MAEFGSKNLVLSKKCDLQRIVQRPDCLVLCRQGHFHRRSNRACSGRRADHIHQQTPCGCRAECRFRQEWTIQVRTFLKWDIYAESLLVIILFSFISLVSSQTIEILCSNSRSYWFILFPSDWIPSLVRLYWDLFCCSEEKNHAKAAHLSQTKLEKECTSQN